MFSLDFRHQKQQKLLYKGQKLGKVHCKGNIPVLNSVTRQTLNFKFHKMKLIPFSSQQHSMNYVTGSRKLQL